MHFAFDSLFSENDTAFVEHWLICASIKPCLHLVNTFYDMC